MRMATKAWATGSVLALTALAGCGGAGEPVATSGSELSGATFTTFDEMDRGCLDSPNGINCNRYTSVEKVYLSGGPSAASLPDGRYFFAVLTPGNPRDALSDSARGNLSAASGNPKSDRYFRISNGAIDSASVSATRGTGVTLNGQFAIRAYPFARTDNPGGVYVLAVCKEGATGPSDCKYDTFKVVPGDDEGCDPEDSKGKKGSDCECPPDDHTT